MARRRPNNERPLGVLFAGLVGANLLAWLWAWTIFAHRPALLGTALLAWVFGLRHAMDADHIAAIDNVVRKLRRDGVPARTVGLWFSLGHSTIVVLACVAIAVTVSSAEVSRFGETAGTIGAAVSAAFLLIIAAVNMLILRAVWRDFRRVRNGEPLASATASSGGAVARLIGPMFRLIRRSWHMYPLGFLFGLGFDTATEVGLLALSATQAAQGLAPWQILVFPALFTAAMMLVDTADSVLMVGAYDWASINPVQKLWYNVTITAGSVAAALLIGGVEALHLIAYHFHLQGPIWIAASRLSDDLAAFGFMIVGVFVLAWGMSAAIYRWRGYGEPNGEAEGGAAGQSAV